MNTSTSLPLSILFTVLALITTLAIAWFAIKFLSGLYNARVSDGEIQIRSTYALGAKQQLYIVNLRGNDYFLGVTSDRIEVIDKLPEQSSSGASPKDPYEGIT